MDKILAVVVILLFIAVVVLRFVRSGPIWDNTYPIIYSKNTPADRIEALPQLSGLGAKKDRTCTEHKGKCLFANCVGPNCWPTANSFCQSKGFERAQEFSVIRSPTGEAIDFPSDKVFKDWVNCYDDDRCEGEFHNVFDHITCIKK